MKTNQIRKTYLDFFASKGHKAVASDSLVPQNDPTLLFTGAGMNQFKDYFLGVKKDLSRATSSQKCLRTADLDEVGRTAYHHSFFEMLGNFSFGDYFKKEAISWAWEFLTEVVKLPKSRLRVTVHQTDQEAFEIWEKHIGIRKDWIYRCGDKSNFWPANAPEDGPNGPCGPCSEIYFDQDPSKGDEGDIESRRFAEIWNLVFTQFDRTGVQQLTPLKNKNIDTGMGLERLACMLQGKSSNFEIDLFQPIHAKIRQSLAIQESQTALRNSLHAIADHARALTFTIADGVIPSNEGRGYVVRKILRRALWHGYQLSNNQKLKKPFLFEVIPSVVDAMKDAYPELVSAQPSIQATVQSEEKRFLETLDTGMIILDKHLNKLKEAGKNQLSAEASFELYDTYGFPDELTRIICEESKVSVDPAGFERLMSEQRVRSKGSTQIAASIFTASGLEKIPHDTPATQFTGYESITEQAKVLWSDVSGTQAAVVLDKTPFYAESGGQVGDQGVLTSAGFEMRVTDTRKLDRFSIHHGEIIAGSIKTGMSVTAKVDAEHRQAVMRNHTATHLLHAALRNLLGEHVRQLGSLVAADRLRFDYAHGQPLTGDEVLKIENSVNAEILKNQAVTKNEEDIETAKKGGAMAFFGEKYGDRVRVVTVPGFSKELCGGIHCAATGDIGSFVIASDSSVASGVRRIEALTGQAALDYFHDLRSKLDRLAATLKVPAKDMESRILKLQDTIRTYEKKKTSSTGGTDLKSVIAGAQKCGAVSLIVHDFGSVSADELHALSDSLKNQSENTLFFIVSSEEEKLQTVLASSTKWSLPSVDLRVIFKSIQPLLALRGGGRADFIRAGGTAIPDLNGKLEQIRKMLSDFSAQKVS
ncbi:MAG TPA: alanine--tRNA ligase [Candidatus Omnitrophica bacterium]|nr:alanine--tRNA ligase [Candidatus Omnitrophota bacterium]